MHHRPGWLPPMLRPFFDGEGETTPLELLDFEALDELMSIRGTSYERRESRLGSVELRAEGDAARVLGTWLATSLSSGVRPSR